MLEIFVIMLHDSKKKIFYTIVYVVPDPEPVLNPEPELNLQIKNSKKLEIRTFKL
jgi:hypothetical protein